MIAALRLANFKAFSDSQSFPIRPLTLIYGPNSAGKSSVIHSIALAHQAMRKGVFDAYRTEIGGESIDLGGFRQYVHRHDEARRVEWTIELETKQLTGRIAELLATTNRVALQFFIGWRSGSAAIDSCNLIIDGTLAIAMSARGEGRLRIDRLDQTHHIFRNIVRGIVLMGTTTDSLSEDDLHQVDIFIDELVPQLNITVKRLVPYLERWQSPEEELAGSLLLPVGKATRSDDLRAAVRTYFPRNLRELIDGVSHAANATLERFHYLGPLRSYPPRHVAFTADHDLNWLAGGGEAWDILRRRDDVRERVNAWLSDRTRLSTPYRIEPRHLFEVEAVAEEVARLAYENDVENRQLLFHDFVTTLEDAGFPVEQLQALKDEIFTRHQDLFADEEALVDRDQGDSDQLEHLLEHAVEGKSVATDLALIDQRTLTPVSHRDVGIGVSQVLPVLVHAYTMQGQILAIEQPEIHLHPGLQAELGDVFIESALGPAKNIFLLETHSEHLLLRIRKRMRQTAKRKATSFPITPADVAVLYVEPVPNGSVVHEIRLDDDGTLLDPWPKGFFEESFRERFSF